MIAVTLAFLLFAPASYGQTTSATVLGNVTDASGAVMSGASVTVTNVATGISRAVPTDDFGNYEVTDLVAGNYDVLIEGKGFKSYLRRSIPLDARATVRVDAKLTVGQTQERVEVEATAPVVTTETGTVTDSVQKQSIQSLPLNYRAVDTSPLALVATIPGVQVDPGFGISVAGSHPAQNETSVDGFSVMNTRFNGPNSELLPSTETVSEVKVTSQLGNAEYGQVGDILFVSHGGTNQYHGSLFEYLQNDALDATPRFAVKRPVVHANDFGAAIGGPIRFPHYNGKDKSFFYFTWESNRFHTSNVISQGVPTPAMRNGDFSSFCSSYDANDICNDPNGTTLKNPFTGQPYPGNKLPSVNAVAANVWNTFYPLPNFASGDIASNYRTVAPAPVDTNLIDVRIDQKLTAKQTLWGRFSWKDMAQTSPLGLLEGNWDFTIHPRSVGINHTYVIRPTLLNEFRFAYVYENDANHFASFPNAAQLVSSTLGLNLPGPFPPGSAIPGFLFFQSPIASTFNLRQTHLLQRRFQGTDNLSWIKGRHTMKFGTDIRRLNDATDVIFLGADSFGRFHFDGSFTGLDMADFELGLPALSLIANPGPAIDEFESAYAFYAQDQVQVTPKLTVDFGLRYEIHPPFVDHTNQLTNFDPADSDVVVANTASLKLAAPGFLQGVNACPGFPGATTPCTNLVLASSKGLPEGLRHTDYTKVLPRLSFAYRLTPGFVVRGGFGMYDETLTGLTAFSLVAVHTSDVRVYPNSISGGVPAIQFPKTVVGGIGVVSPPGTSDFRTATPFNLHDPYAEQWSLSVERELGHETGLRVSYTGMRSVNLLINPDLNQIAPQAKPYDPAAKPFPNFRIIYTTANGGEAAYHAMQAVLTHRSKGLTLQSSYVFAKNLSDAEGSGGNLNGGFAQENGPFVQNRFNPHGDYGDVSFTRRHRSLTTYTYELPFGKGKTIGGGMSGVLNGVVGGWQTSGILILQSGPYLTPFYFGGTDPSGTGANFKDPGQRPDRVCNGNISNPTANGYFNASCFVIPPDNIGRFGNSGVGVLKGPGTVNFSAGLAKVFPIKESLQLRFEATANNLFNHANLAVPDMNIAATSDFGVIHGIQNVEGTGARTLQFGLRLSF
jgi:hypothetical protein